MIAKTLILAGVVNPSGSWKLRPVRPSAEHKTASGRLRNAAIMIVDRYGRPDTPNCPRSFERPMRGAASKLVRRMARTFPTATSDCATAFPNGTAPQPQATPPANQSPTRQPKPHPPAKAPPASQPPKTLTPTAPPAAARSRRSAHPHPNTSTAPAPRRTAPGTAPRTARPPAATPHGTPTPPRARRRSR
jgi:hypothetical protein